MNGIVLYKSKYGATKKYADWIGEETGFDVAETKGADIKQVLTYDTVLLGGGIYASGIAGLSFLKKHIDVLREKKLAVFCVGASPHDAQTIEEMYAHNFKGVLHGTKCFYCRGAWDEAAMTLRDRTLCKLLKKMVAKKDPADYAPWEAALVEAFGQKRDWCDREYLKPLLAFIDGE